MKTPRELLDIRDDLAKKVAEGWLDRRDAKTQLRTAADKYPELADELKDDWSDNEIDRGVSKYVSKRNKIADAAIARKLAELGVEQPDFDGKVPPISQDDPSYSTTLADYADFLSVNIANSWRMLKSFERREEDNEVLAAAAGGNLNVTREQAVDALKRTPEAKRKAIRAEVKAKLAAERRAFTKGRYGAGGQAAEG